MSAQSQLIQSQSSSPEPDAQSPSNSICAESNKLPLSWQQAMTLLDTIPGVARQSAQLLLAEVGTDMQRFPTAAHLCKWAGICLGNHESAGKQYSGKTPPSNRWLRGMLVQMANAAVRCKTSYFACVYRRLAARRGHKRVVIAVAHRLGNCRLSYAAAASALSRLPHHCSRTTRRTTISQKIATAS